MNRYIFLLLLLSLFLYCGNTPAVTTEQPKGNEPTVSRGMLSREQLVMSEQLNDLFSGLNSKGLFNGNVLVAKAGKIIYRKSHGFLDKGSLTPLTDSSQFQLASVSKVITATAVLLLHERQQLDINQPFTTYFPDFPFASIKVRDLLDHRSGLQNYIYTLNKEINQPDYQMTNDEMYQAFITRNCRLAQRPDSRFNYCNTNYALLALLVEKVSGKAFNVYLKEEIFQPLGMRHSCTIRDLDLNGSNVTRAYDTRWRPVHFDASDYVLGDKSVYSTTYDLFLFSEALYQNRIISKATQDLAYKAYSREKRESNYGYGWRMHDFTDPDKKEVFHNGWWHGYRSAFHRRLKDTLTIVVLSNQLNSSTYQTYRIYDVIDKVSTANPHTEEQDD